jgi:hypothetical protein
MRFSFLLPPPGPRRAALATIVALLAVAAPGRAGFVTSTFTDVNPGEVVTIYNPYSKQNESGWAGVYNFKDAVGDITGSYNGFCIEINQDIYGGLRAQFSVADLSTAPDPNPGPGAPNGMGGLRANLIRELWSNVYDQHLITNNSSAAAFQLAIWEIINETNTDPKTKALVLNVQTGILKAQADQPTLRLANTWLGGLDLSGNGPKDNSLIALENATYQDYVTSVPAPPGLVLAGIGGACCAFAAVRRRRGQRRGLVA